MLVCWYWDLELGTCNLGCALAVSSVVYLVALPASLLLCVAVGLFLLQHLLCCRVLSLLFVARWPGPNGTVVVVADVSVVSAVCLNKYYYMILRRVVAIQ